MQPRPRTCLVAGSYPPAPGPAAAATVAAVRRAWGDGREVVVVSPRPSAAPLVLPVTGAAVGRGLVRLRVSAGAVTGLPGSRCEALVVCMEPGWPLGRGYRPARGRPVGRAELERAARSLAVALSGFERAELVVTGDLGVPEDVLALLWPEVDMVTAGSEEVAAALRSAGAPGVSVVEPYGAAGLPTPQVNALPVVERVAPAGPYLPGALSPVEPADWLLVARSRRLLGSAARKVLGPRAPGVRAYLLRSWLRLRRAVGK
jgi:hypothetical protein